MASSRATVTSSSSAIALTGPLGVSMWTSARWSLRCNGPWVIRTDWVLACGTMLRTRVIHPFWVTIMRSSQP